MLFLGHIAASLILADATQTDRTAAVVGNLTPDVIDKTGAWLLKAMPESRWLAHGLPFASAACLVASVLLDRRRARGYAIGYAGHLVCDLWAGGRVPWLAPFVRLKRRPKKHRLRNKLLFFGADVVGAPIVWLLLRSKTQ